MCRTAEEVPWLLQRADLKKELYHIVLSVDILVQLYSGLVCTPYIVISVDYGLWSQIICTGYMYLHVVSVDCVCSSNNLTWHLISLSFQKSW